MSDRMVARPFIRVTDFQVLNDPVTSTKLRRYGTCGPTAVSVAASSALNRIVSLQEVYDWERTHQYKDQNGVLQRWCDESGASTLGSGIACLTGPGGLGCVLAEYSGFHEPWDWGTQITFFRKHAGIDPIVVETSVGQRLVDSVSGMGENATNLEFHLFSVMGYHAGGASDLAGGKVLPEGLWVADGDNYAGGNDSAHGFNAANVLQFYPLTTAIQPAKLVGAFALRGRVVALQIAQTNGLFVLNPDGSWHAPRTDHNVHGGFLTAYQTMQGLGSLNGLSDLGLPETEELTVPGVKPGPSGFVPVATVFERGALCADPDHVVDSPPGSGSIYKLHLDHPLVKALLCGVPAPVPTPVPPTVVFDPPTVTETTVPGASEVSYTVKQTYHLSEVK